MGITWEEAEVAAQNRSEWRQSVPNASIWMRVESRSRSQHKYKSKTKRETNFIPPLPSLSPSGVMAGESRGNRPPPNFSMSENNLLPKIQNFGLKIPILGQFKEKNNILQNWNSVHPYLLCRKLASVCWKTATFYPH